jgi:hypothetical protein
MTAPRLRPADLPGWPRLLTITLAAAYVGHWVSSFGADIGKLWPKPIGGTRRTVWDRLALDQAIDMMPGAGIVDRGTHVDVTRDARREAWNAEQRKRKKTDAKG